MKAPLWLLLAGIGASVPASVTAQITVGLGGVAPITFDSSPVLPASEWASNPAGVGTNSSSYFTPAQVAAAVQTLNQNSITNPLARITSNNLSEDARHHTASGYLVTQSSGVGATVLKATLRNTATHPITRITVSYDFGI